MAKGRTGRDWDGQNRANIDKYTRQIKSLFNSIAGEAALIGSSVDTVNPDRLFTFADYPKTKQRADKLISNLQNDLNTIIVNGVRSSWTLSNNKNNELAQQVFGNNVGKLSKAEYRRYFSNNGVALDQFIKRKENGLSLSDRVWRYSQQFKKEIEMGLDLGIGNGLSADQMARDLKQYLQFPDKLFRRVRDKHGELQLSKAAQAFHPGAGVYRSSYKNAMRLSRTENNMAYKASDHERWNEFDFVVGFEIRLSNNPNHCPMCEALAGKYPKTYKFVSWHPQCRCAAIPILKTVDELAEETKAILAGEPTTTESSRKITDLPPNFKSWMNDNKERLERAKSKPYFLRDNEGLIVRESELPNLMLIPKTPSGSSALYKQVTKVENEIRNNKKFETAVAFDKDGKVLLDKRGQQFSVTSTNEEAKLLKDTIFTHNHPRGWGHKDNSMMRIGNSFSDADIITAIRNDIAEIRAVTPNYTFVMKRPEKGWGMTYQEASAKIKRINNYYLTEFSKRIDKGTTTPNKASIVHWHSVWKVFARNNGFEYLKKKTI